MDNRLIDEIKTVMSEAEVLYNDQQVLSTVDRMADEITKELGHSHPLILCVMTGGMIPTGLLLSRLCFPLQVDYIHATRYRGETEGKELVWLKKPEFDIKDRTVLIVDDILDKGQTLEAIVKEMKNMLAKKIYTAVLVEKDTDRQTQLKTADFTGLTVPDRYVFGCGMDYKTYHRNGCAIYAVKE